MLPKADLLPYLICSRTIFGDREFNTLCPLTPLLHLNAE
jgi:hypothetical protein